MIQLFENYTLYNNSNFKKWFKSSKVIDTKGNPLKVYHGSMTNFSIFNISKSTGTHGETDQVEGIYFTDDIEGANWYALVEDDPRFVKTCYLSIQNPYKSFNYKVLKEKLNIEELKDVRDILISKGYDGLIVENGFYSNGLHKLYLAFYPNQVKHTDNNGDFSLTDDNIYR